VSKRPSGPRQDKDRRKKHTKKAAIEPPLPPVRQPPVEGVAGPSRERAVAAKQTTKSTIQKKKGAPKSGSSRKPISIGSRSDDSSPGRSEPGSENDDPASSDDSDDNSTWELLKPLWALEDRPANMKKKRKVGS